MGGWRWHRWALVLLLLLAWALRVPLASVYPLHPDEALYGYWALLIGWGGDPWLASVPVYKPPLLPYLLTGGLALGGRSELVVRFWGLSCGLLTIPLTAALTRALYRSRWTAVGAAVGMALSPLAIALSPTAFLDPPMVVLGLAACLAAACNRPAWAGGLAGLSFAIKQTGLVWLPLVIVLQLVAAASREPVEGWRVILSVGGWVLIAGLIFGWDAVRMTQGARSFWRVGVAGYGGLRLIWPQELGPRWRGWWDAMRTVFGALAVYLGLIAGGGVLVGRALVRRLPTLARLVDLILVAFSLIYFLLHWLLAFPIWERYLLPLVPVLAILLARGLRALIGAFRGVIQTWLPDNVVPGLRIDPADGRRNVIQGAGLLLLVAGLIGPAVGAAHHQHPVASGRAAYDGLREVAAFLQGLPEGSVVYHHWLGWQHHFYLFDAPVFLAYWPTPAWLARDVQAFGEREPRYLVFPAWESTARVKRALADVGYRLTAVLSTPRRNDGSTSFTVYHVEPSLDR